MMKKLTLIASVVVFLAMILTSLMLALMFNVFMVSATTTITIDGDFSDWSGVAQYDVAPNPTESTGDVTNGPNNDLDLVDIYITDDGAYIYFKYNVVGTMNESSNYYEAFLDTDRSNATGYRGPSGTWTSGADYMVENNDLYEYNGTGGSNWSWVSSGAPNFARALGNNNTVEMRIPRATIGETGTSDDLDFLIRATDNNTSPTQWDVYPEAIYVSVIYICTESFCYLGVTVTFIASNAPYSGGVPNTAWYPPGATYTLTFKVKNTGTCPYDDVYLLDAYIATPLGWSQPVAPAVTSPLGPGEFVNVQVTGSVPAAPSEIDTRLVRLKATSQNHGATDDAYRRVGVDPVLPLEVTSLQSPSHYNAIGQWNDPQSRDNTVTVTWTAASDGIPGFGSGVDGYSIVWDNNANALPPKMKDIEEDVTSVTSATLADGKDWYFHIRSVDNVGNWDETAAHIGPFYIDVTPPTAEIQPKSQTVDKDEPATFHGSDSHDKTLGIEQSGIDHYEWSFGDGSPVESGTGEPGTKSHAYSQEGSYTVTLRLWDKAGNDGTGTAITEVGVEVVPEFPLGVEAAAGIGLMVVVVYMWLRRRKNEPIVGKRYTKSPS